MIKNELKKELRGLSLVEVLLSIVIISILIGIIVQITLLYEKFSREWGFLESSVIDAKLIAVSLERDMITSSKIIINQTNDHDQIILDRNEYTFFKNLDKRVVISPPGKTKNLKKEIYWNIQKTKIRNLAWIYEISFFVYNREALRQRGKNVRKLVYYILVYRYD